MSEISQHIAVSRRVDLDGLDWGQARRIGLSAKEIECLSFFADIESQTIYYFLEAASLKVSRTPEFLTFLTLWNYEEYFHSQAITRLLEECGVDVAAATARSAEVRGQARLKAQLEDGLQRAIAAVAPKTFIALWMTWGATQELLTTQAYEEIAQHTANPGCAEVCRRIAKQERRHFAYYFGNARVRLDEAGPWGRRVVRKAIELLWTPVGNGVKTPAESAALAQRLFPDGRFDQVLTYIDKRISSLPGMEDFDACSSYGKRMNVMQAKAGMKGVAIIEVNEHDSMLEPAHKAGQIPASASA